MFLWVLKLSFIIINRAVYFYRMGDGVVCISVQMFFVEWNKCVWILKSFLLKSTSDALWNFIIRKNTLKNEYKNKHTFINTLQ